ncbi:MAG: hypothetical protein HY077_00315 [Elusimicrobia bacterium]|nr:hypothetical protein [Elusimicrobiota bacterium]
MKKSLFLLPWIALSGCSAKTIALHQTVALLDSGAQAFYDEPDPVLAQEVMGSNMKLLEALLVSEPDNARLLARAAESFNGYAFLFLEDAAPERAKGFYKRGRDHALKLLARKNAFKGLAEKNLDAFTQALAKAGPSDVEALFWAGFGWANSINLSKDDPGAVAELPKAVALMQRVRDLSPDYQFAGPELFFAIYYASRPAILGGDVAKARTYFEDARARTSGKFLMTYVLEARFLAVAVQDQELFKALLTRVAQTPAGALPGSRMQDEVAKRKAAALMGKINDYF